MRKKIRFRIVMYSDPGTNYEGVGIDDIHIFEKAPVFTDSLTSTISQSVSGNNWIDFDQNGKRILSINPNGQDLGNVKLSLFTDTVAIRDTAGQYYLGTKLGDSTIGATCCGCIGPLLFYRFGDE